MVIGFSNVMKFVSKKLPNVDFAQENYPRCYDFHCLLDWLSLRALVAQCRNKTMVKLIYQNSQSSAHVFIIKCASKLEGRRREGQGIKLATR